MDCNKSVYELFQVKSEYHALSYIHIAHSLQKPRADHTPVVAKWIRFDLVALKKAGLFELPIHFTWS